MTNSTEWLVGQAFTCFVSVCLEELNMILMDSEDCSGQVRLKPKADKSFCLLVMLRDICLSETG